MTSETDITGERFVPEAMGGELIEAEHRARYALAAPLVSGRRVLDAGCGVGWGTGALLDAGAASAVGVDLSEDAIDDARRRVPAAAFDVGDLLQLPYDDDAFDVVVCFEALEHTGDTERTLDELSRVLRPGGVLLVSSPNPRVYPAGNPFHLNEVVPEELHRAVAKRLAHTALYGQYLLIASAVLRVDGPAELHAAGLDTIKGSLVDNDPYSVVVASASPLELPGPVVRFASSRQVTGLAAASVEFEERLREFELDQVRVDADHRALLSAIEAERAQWREGDVRIAAERQFLLDERENQLAQINALTARREELQQHADGLAELRTRLESERSMLNAQLTDVESRLAAALGRLALTASQRDRLGALLVDSEQEIALTMAEYADRQHAVSAELAALRALAESRQAAADELERVLATRAWRAVQPLRRIRGILPVRGRR